MKDSVVVLALLMWLATYPSRVVPWLVPGVERLPPLALTYLRLVGPAILASLAAVGVFVTGDSELRFGVEAIAVAVCVLIVVWRRNVLLGLVVAVALTAAARASGLA
jgi:branched-subunit amino acid transport protein